MKVMEVHFAFVKPREGLIAFASIPDRKVGDAHLTLFHLIRRQIGHAIEQAVLEK
jgi:hypothetical protein